MSDSARKGQGGLLTQGASFALQLPALYVVDTCPTHCAVGATDIHGFVCEGPRQSCFWGARVWHGLGQNRGPLSKALPHAERGRTPADRAPRHKRHVSGAWRQNTVNTCWSVRVRSSNRTGGGGGHKRDQIPI